MPRTLGRSSKRLSLQAKEILDAAKGRGEVFVLRSNGTIKWVASGSHHFHDYKNPAVRAAYLEGFKELQSKGLLVHDSGNQYRLAVKIPELREWLRH